MDGIHIYLSALRDSAIVLFLSWRPTVTQGGAASITMIPSMVLSGSERLRCVQEEQMVASKVFRK